MQLAKKIGFLTAIAALLIPAMGWSLDASHTNTPGYDIQCGSCHWTHSTSTPPWENAQVPDAPDNTINNRRCYVCHDSTRPLIPGAETHSTSTTSNAYWTTQGGWKTECVTCHDPHQQRQTRAWGVPTYLQQGTQPSVGDPDINGDTQITLATALPDNINYHGYYFMPDKNYPFYYKIAEPDTRGLTTIKVKGQVLTAYVKTGGYAIVYGKNVKDYINYINPGNQTVGGEVRLYRPSGLFGPADAGSITTSVCYVCHTQQAHYSSKPGADTSHNAGTDCESCHKHMQGFKPACDACHGNPPTSPATLVWVTIAGGSTPGTGSTTAGAHGTHVNTKAISCDFCHYGSAGSGATHNAGSVTLGFRGFGGTSAGGTYNGQSGVTYNATATTPLTSTSSGGFKQCSNVYCHGSTMASNGGSNTSPTWDVASTGACGTCHGSDSANPPQLGSHVEHTSASTGYSFTCTLCHNTAAGTHVNGKVEWMFDTGDNRTNGGQYNSAASGTTNTPAPSGTYQSCSNLYCHSIVQTTTGGALSGAVGEYKTTPTWGTTWNRARTNAGTLCSSCHEYRTLGSGSHLKHVGDTIGNYRYHCGKCHYDNTCTNCHSLDMNTLVMSPAVHANGQVDVKLWTSIIGGTYSGTPTPGDGSFGNCNNLYCHSKGTVATGAFEAPNVTPTWGGTLPSDCTGCHGNDKDSATPMSSGSHTTHVVSSGMDCVKCHTTTVTNSRTLYDRNQHVNPDIKAVNIHFDAASNPGGTATYNGSASPVAKTPGTAYGACSNLYCHGTVSPVWGGTLASSCDSCHSGQGAGTAVTKSYTTAHSSKHTATYLLACENCHTQMNSNLANRISHAGGDVNPATPQTAEVSFTDQTGSTQYGGGGSTFRYSNLYANPYGATTPTPIYSPAGTSAGSDPKNASITWTAGSCSNVWCHSNANPADGTNSYSSPAWNSAIDCGSCHRKPDIATNMTAAGTPAQMSVSHVKHIATDQYGQNSNFTCNTCHSNTASDSSTVSNTANHVNGAKNVALNAWAGGSFATNQCSNVYCHSQGTSTTAPPAPNVVASWGGSLDPNLTGTNCEGCHGAKYGGGYVNTMNTNVHDAHINPATVDRRGTNYGCSECHNATMSGTGMSIGNYANHVNKLVNIQFVGTAPHVNRDTDAPTFNGSSTTGANGATKAVGTPVGNCANVYCHSVGNLNSAGNVVAVGTPAVGFRTMTWSTATSVGCDGCHGDQAGKAHPVYTSGGAGTDTANSHVKHVEGSSITCDTCHTATTASTTIPPTSVIIGGMHLDRQETVTFKNMWGNTGTYNAGKTCSATYCHGTGPSPAWGGTVACGSCHAANNTLAGSHSQHYETATTASSRAAANISTTTEYRFNCGVCHYSTPHGTGPENTSRTAQVAFDGTIGSGTYSEGATSSTDAVTNFKYTNATCSASYCHGNYAGSGLNATPSWGTAASGDCGTCHGAGNTLTTRPASGSHERHVSNTITGKNSYSYDREYSCKLCHNGSVETTGANNYTIADKSTHVNKFVNNAFNTSDSRLGGSPAYSIASGTEAPSDGVSRAYGNCSNVYCHSNVQGSGGNGTGGPSKFDTVQWGAPKDGIYPYNSVVNCTNGSCHAVGNHSLGISTGSHTRHVQYRFGQSLNGNCLECHRWQANGSSCSACHGTSGEKTDHVDGYVDISFEQNVPGTPGVVIVGSSAAYNDNTATPGTPGNGFFSCSNTYCHSAGTSVSTGTIPANTTPVWGSTGPLACDSCHSGGTATGPSYASGAPNKANSHNRHVVGNGNKCVDCHSSTVNSSNSVIDTSKHVNQAYDIAGAQITSYTFATDGGTCANACHGSTTPKWGGASLNCDGCHKANNTLAGNHGRHYGVITVATSGDRTPSNTSSGTTYKFSCGVCHNSATTHAGGVVSANQAAQVAFDATLAGASAAYSPGALQGLDGGFNWTAGTCSATYCHSNGNGSAGNNTTFTWATTSGTFTCESCHNYDKNTTNKMSSGNHTEHINNQTDANLGSFGCQECHNGTTTNGTSITEAANHVNRVKDVSVLKGGNWASPTCSNTYCHSTGNTSAPTANLPVVYSGTHYTQMTWGDATDIGCTGCHGKSTTTGAPDYTNAGAGQPGANSHPKHTSGGSGTCVNCHSSTTTTGTSIITGSLHLNGARDVVQGNGKTFTYAQATQSCSSISCHFNGTAQWGATLICSDCHGSLSGAHGKHTSITGAAYGNTGISTTGGVYNFGCGNCHPVNSSYHADGTVEISLNPADGGTLKGKNSPSANRSGSSLTSVCNLTYCHSDGTKTGAAIVSGASPAWSGYTGTDRCAMCHLNSPNTGSHQNHVMAGIHYDDIFTGTTGLSVMGNTATGAHGNAATATTLNCNICHYGTVTTAANDKNLNANANCGSCHNGTTAPLKGNVAIDAASSLHLNGVINVQLKTGAVLSKAQIRNDASTATGAPAGWTRNGGYKASGAYDSATINSGDWASATKTCLTACHLNQSSPAWGTPTTCASCHATLPQ